MNVIRRLVMIEVPLYRTDTVIPYVPLTNDKSRSVFTSITQRAEELVGGGGEAQWRIQGSPPLFLDQTETQRAEIFF